MPAGHPAAAFRFEKALSKFQVVTFRAFKLELSPIYSILASCQLSS
jgi:hypothetical protein